MFRLLLAISSFFVGFETAPGSQQEEGGGTQAGDRGSAARDRGVGEIKGGQSGI